MSSNRHDDWQGDGAGRGTSDDLHINPAASGNAAIHDCMLHSASHHCLVSDNLFSVGRGADTQKGTSRTYGPRERRHISYFELHPSRKLHGNLLISFRGGNRQELHREDLQ